MAYSSRYNPDSLPAHAEPENAARPSDPYATKPPPPQPQAARPQFDDRYTRTSPQAGYKSPVRATAPTYDNYDDSHRRHSPRYNDYQSAYAGPSSSPPPPRNSSYGNSGPSRAPPPGAYNDGPAPQGPSQPNRPASSRPPPTPAPPRDGSDMDALWPLFRQVDKDRSGHLTENELGTALVNGDYTSFDPHTVKMMIRMFDVDHSGTIDFEEFCGLWGFLSEWRKLFDRFDVDHSGTISLDEFSSALVAFGYRLSTDYVRLLFSTYDTRRRGFLSFDLFVQACISLKRMTDVFKKYDTDRDGYITLSFEQFLTGSQSLFLVNSISANTDTGLY